MDTLSLYAIAAVTTLIAVAMITVTGLKGFTAWISLKRAELEAANGSGAGVPNASTRIELADLRERLRKLEAIAAGVEL
jgi:hypothetical protein